MTVGRPGLDRARTDRVDPDVVFCKVHGKAARKLGNGTLRRVVRNEIRLGYEGRDRRDVYYRPSVRPAHRRQHLAHAIRIADDVYAEHLHPVVLCHVLDAAKHEGRSVVYEQVDVPVRGHGRPDCPLHRRGVRRIGLDEDRGPPGLFDHPDGLASRILLQLGHRHPRTFGCKPPRNCPSNSVPAARNNRVFIL